MSNTCHESARDLVPSVLLGMINSDKVLTVSLELSASGVSACGRMISNMVRYRQSIPITTSSPPFVTTAFTVTSSPNRERSAMQATLTKNSEK